MVDQDRGAKRALTEHTLAVLAQHDRAAVRRNASRGLRRLLRQIDGLARVRLVTEWSGSKQRRLRVAMARALCGRFPVLGVVPALDQLARDEHADVRRAACVASARRMRDGGDLFAEIVRNGTRDRRGSVRVIAIAALEATVARTPNPEASIEALYVCTRSKRPASAERARRALRQLGSYSIARELLP